MVSRFSYKQYTHGDNRVIRLKLPARDIGFFSGSMEAYEGVGLVRTIDPRHAIVEVLVPADRENEFMEILHAIMRSIPIEVLSKK